MLGPLTILIADHDTQLYKEHYDSIDWTALGFEIKGVCKTGEAALTSAEIDQPDFLILDCHLPGQAIRSLAEMFLKISPSTRILLLCELSDIEEFNTCFFNQPVSCLLKDSLHLSSLLSAMKNLLQRFPKQKPTDSAMQEIRQYIAQNYAEPLTLYQIADHFGFNYSYLSTCFREHSQYSFREYLNQQRILHAIDLLENSSILISRIYEVVGFSDHSYFCRVFKKIIGATPTEYRKKCVLLHTLSSSTVSI